jgi:hypothetical protein
LPSLLRWLRPSPLLVLLLLLLLLPAMRRGRIVYLQGDHRQ